MTPDPRYGHLFDAASASGTASTGSASVPVTRRSA